MQHIAEQFIEAAKARIDLAEFIGQYVDGGLKRRGREYVGPCPLHQGSNRSESFTVNPQRGFFKCFSCEAGGDALTFLRKYHNIGFRAAAAQLCAFAGIDTGQPVDRLPAVPPKSKHVEDEEIKRQQRVMEYAFEVYEKSQPIAGTLAQKYLRCRGIDQQLCADLRFHPSLKHVLEVDGVKHVTHWPAMVAAVRDVRGKFIGIHRTFLNIDGTGKAPKDKVPKAKMMLGATYGGGIQLTPVSETLAIGEGIETCLSVRQAMLAARDNIHVWAAMSLSNIAGAGVGTGLPHPVPKREGQCLPAFEPDMKRPGIVLPQHVKNVIIIADSDNSDPHSAEVLYRRAAKRWANEGRTVKIMQPPVGMDANDWLLARGCHD